MSLVHSSIESYTPHTVYILVIIFVFPIVSHYFVTKDGCKYWLFSYLSNPHFNIHLKCGSEQRWIYMKLTSCHIHI